MSDIKKQVLFRNPTGKVWHILAREDKRQAYGICNSFGYWFGGYHNDHPEMTKEAMPRKKYDGSQKLCKQCVAQAYGLGIILKPEKPAEDK